MTQYQSQEAELLSAIKTRLDSTIAVLKVSIGEGTYAYGASCSGYLGLALAALLDVTVLYAT